MKMWIIIKKEYKQIVKKKSFLIATLLTPILMSVFIFLPLLLTKVAREEKIIEIADYSGIIQTPFLEKSRDSLEANALLKLKFQLVSELKPQQTHLIDRYEEKMLLNPDADLELLQEYRQRVLDKEIDGLVLIPEKVKENRRIYFCALNISDFSTNKYITSTVQKIISEKILTEQNIPLEIVEDAVQDVLLGTFKVKKTGTTRSTSGMEYMMSIFMLTFLFSIIMAYG